jgi:fructose-1,6-bisphosphatase/inositol monophosphatase family enzyme
MIRDVHKLLARIRAIQDEMRDQVVMACEQITMEQLSKVVTEQAGDTIFAIDKISEDVLLSHFEQLGREWSFMLIAEGMGEDGILAFPSNTDPTDAELCIIVDPIDGSRGLMYQKRPAWILTGVATNQGSATRLSDVELAVQTEIPLIKQHLCDSLWAIAGQGVGGERFNRFTNERYPLLPQPSQASTIAQGFGCIARFFSGGQAELAAIGDEVIERILEPIQSGKALIFEDQYISTGGQLYELMMGHDRWIADFRSLVTHLQKSGLCCHPYDLCTALIAQEAGVIVTNEYGQQLSSPLDVTTNLAWMGYANAAIYQQVAPILFAVLEQHTLLDRRS